MPSKSFGRGLFSTTVSPLMLSWSLFPLDPKKGKNSFLSAKLSFSRFARFPWNWPGPPSHPVLSSSLKTGFFCTHNLVNVQSPGLLFEADLQMSLSFCWSSHVSSLVWSNVSMITSLQDRYLEVFVFFCCWSGGQCRILRTMGISVSPLPEQVISNPCGQHQSLICQLSNKILKLVLCSLHTVTCFMYHRCEDQPPEFSCVGLVNLSHQRPWQHSFIWRLDMVGKTCREKEEGW